LQGLYFLTHINLYLQVDAKIYVLLVCGGAFNYLGKIISEMLYGWKKSISTFGIILILSTLSWCGRKFCVRCKTSPPSVWVETHICRELESGSDGCAVGLKHGTYCCFKPTVIPTLSNFNISLDWTVIFFIFIRGCWK
jgi:hypothetical protein